METDRWTRRRMLKAIAAAAAGSTVAPFPLCGAAAAADLELRLMAAPGEARIRDGQPRFAVDAGGEYVYEFTVRNPAGTYLYHPHPHGRTAAQVYGGLAGLLVVREPDEAKRALPGREHELAIVIQDRRSGN